jgi:tripartite-type tricarboxylate transporter receptor subunit TctC
VKSRFVALTFATLSHIGIASAQGYPSRYITIIGPFTAGSPVDTISRILASGMSRVLGQQLVVENITGAGGTTGITRAAKAASDGYTMVIASTGTHAGAAALYPNLGYDPSDESSLGARWNSVCFLQRSWFLRNRSQCRTHFLLHVTQ